MARLEKEELNKLKKELSVYKLWSYSRVNSYKNCPYSYFLKYIKEIKEKETSIYAFLGNCFHDLLERYYNNEIKYEEMIIEAENTILNVDLSDLKFDRSDDDKNNNIKNKYFSCIKHFFMNHVPVKEKLLTEKFLTIRIGKHAFIGYIDTVHKEDNNFFITDYKTSTIYTGKKIDQEGKQLILYSLGLKQKGVPLENIKCRWNFLKYLSLTFTQKNGKEKTMHCERNSWVGKITSRLKSDLKEIGYSEYEIELTVSRCLEENSISSLPEEIQSLYKIGDCYVEVPLSEEVLNQLEGELYKLIIELYLKEKEYENTKDESIWHKKVDDSCSYWCNNICGYDTTQCPCIKEYLENRDLFLNQENKKENSDEDWMKELGLI